MARLKEKTAAAEKSVAITLKKDILSQMPLLLVGTMPLIVHAWSEKARKAMRDKHMKNAIEPREAKVPVDEFEAAKYKSPLGWEGVPAHGLKGCFTEGARFVGGSKQMNMTVLKGALRVLADCPQSNPLRLYSPNDPTMREDLVSIGGGMSETVDLRYRPEYWPWALKVTVQYPTSMFSKDQIGDLIRAAGAFNGFCEWRPGSPKSVTGSFGTFEIANPVQEAEFEKLFKIKVR
jgi:hypothetical protein